MPELDQDLVNLILLGLLALIALELLGVWGSIGRNRKAIDRLAKARERDSWTSIPAGNRSEDSFARAQPVQTAQREPEPAYQAAAVPAGATSQPAAVSSRAAPQAQAAPAAATTAAADAAADEPQEQPFERDGRWWFRRGSELLVYDEASGQWLPAQSAPGGGPSATRPMQTISDVSGASGTQASGEQGFWKCPSCGAVNGSTAATCRMCFTARP